MFQSYVHIVCPYVLVALVQSRVVQVLLKAGANVCRFANQGLNTFLFAMMSLELKHRAPKVSAACIADVAVY